MPCQIRRLIGSIGKAGADLFDREWTGLLALVLDEDLHVSVAWGI